MLWIFMMIIASVEAVVLTVLMRILGRKELRFAAALLLAVGASFGANILVPVCVAAVGSMGVLAGVGIAAVGVSVVMFAMYGIEIKRALATGVALVVTHITVLFVLSSSSEAIATWNYQSMF